MTMQVKTISSHIRDWRGMGPAYGLVLLSVFGNSLLQFSVVADTLAASQRVLFAGYFAIVPSLVLGIGAQLLLLQAVARREQATSSTRTSSQFQFVHMAGLVGLASGLLQIVPLAGAYMLLAYWALARSNTTRITRTTYAVLFGFGLLFVRWRVATVVVNYGMHWTDVGSITAAVVALTCVAIVLRGHGVVIALVGLVSSMVAYGLFESTMLTLLASNYDVVINPAQSLTVEAVDYFYTRAVAGIGIWWFDIDLREHVAIQFVWHVYAMAAVLVAILAPYGWVVIRDRQFELPPENQRPIVLWWLIATAILHLVMVQFEYAGWVVWPYLAWWLAAIACLVGMWRTDPRLHESLIVFPGIIALLVIAFGYFVWSYLGWSAYYSHYLFASLGWIVGIVAWRGRATPSVAARVLASVIIVQCMVYEPAIAMTVLACSCALILMAKPRASLLPSGPVAAMFLGILLSIWPANQMRFFSLRVIDIPSGVGIEQLLVTADHPGAPQHHMEALCEPESGTYALTPHAPDTSLVTFNLTDGKAINTTITQLPIEAPDKSLVADGEWYSIIAGYLRVQNFATGDVTFPAKLAERNAYHMNWSPDKTRFAFTLDSLSQCYVADRSGRMLATYEMGVSESAGECIELPDNRFLLSYKNEQGLGEIALINGQDASQIAVATLDAVTIYNQVAIDPTYRMVYRSIDATGDIYQFSADNLARTGHVRVKPGVRNVLVSPDNPLLVYAWNYATGQIDEIDFGREEIRRSWNIGPIMRNLRFDCDEDYLLAASNLGVFRIRR